MRYAIGVDAGTSNTKAVLFDEIGRECYAVSVQTELEHPNPTAVEGNLPAMAESVFSCVRKCVSESGKGTEIAAIGITATGDGTCLLGIDGSPVRNMLYWCDGQSGSIVEEWNKNGTAEAAFAICGTCVFPGSQSAQLAHLLRTEPESLEKTAHIVHAKDWLFSQFTGVIQTDETDESLPMLNALTRKYDDRLFSLFGLEALQGKFPEVVPTLENHAEILPGLADRLGVPRGIPVCSGPMDVSACAVGAGAVNPGQACSVLGTAAIHEIVTDRPDLRPHMAGMTLCHAGTDRWLRMLAPMIATPNLDWFLGGIGRAFREHAEREGRELYEFLEERARSVLAGCGGLVYHPYIFPGGERAPFVNTGATGSFCGITTAHGEDHFLRAVYEGVGYAMRDCYESMPTRPAEVRLSGGGAKSGFWCQMLADMTGLAIRIPEGSEFGAKGAALCAMTAAGIFESLPQAVRACVRIDREYLPRPEDRAAYDAGFLRYVRIRKSMTEVWNLGRNDDLQGG